MKVIITKKNVFFVAYVLTLCSWMLDNVKYIGGYLDYARYLAYILLVILIIQSYKKFTLKRFILEVLGTIIVLISSVTSESNTLLTLWIFILAARKIDFQELLKIDFYTKFILVIVVSLLYFLGFTGNSTFYSYFGTIRSSIGFANPNVFGYYIFSICADYIYLNGERIKFYHIVILIVMALIVGYVSYSRTSILLITLLAFITSMSKIVKNVINKRIAKIICLSLFLIFSLFSYVVANNYDSSDKNYYMINELLSGRVLNASRYLKKYDINLIGQKIELTTNDRSYTYYLDNGYIKLLLNYGLLTFLVIFLIYYANIYTAYKKQNIVLILLFAMYLIYGISENAIFLLNGNVFLLYFMCEKKTN